jgi:hypothetical protein
MAGRFTSIFYFGIPVMTPLADKQQILDLVTGIDRLPPFGAVPDTLTGAKRSLAAWLTRMPGSLSHPRVALFAGSQNGADSAQIDGARRYFDALLSAEAPLCDDIQGLDADLRLYELDLKQPRPIDEQTRIRACAYGMMAVEPGVDILVLSGFGGGIAMAATALMAALPQSADPFDTLDSETVAALAGAIMAARLAGTPVLLDGGCAMAALMVLCRINPLMADHCATDFTPSQDVQRWFRQYTDLLFMPHGNKTDPGMGGVALAELALSLKSF